MNLCRHLPKIDEKFKDNILHYILQSLLATATIFVILLFLDVLTEAAIITALGASSFIVFTMPHHYSADYKRVVGGYLVGLFTGILFYFFSQSGILFPMLSDSTIMISSAAAAVGFTIFFMVIFNLEHAPACGIALGLVINDWAIGTIIFILTAVFWIVIIKTMAKKWLIDLT